MILQIFSDLNYFVGATFKPLFSALQTKNEGQNATKYLALKYKFIPGVTAITCRKNRVNFVEFVRQFATFVPAFWLTRLTVLTVSNKEKAHTLAEKEDTLIRNNSLKYLKRYANC